MSGTPSPQNRLVAMANDDYDDDDIVFDKELDLSMDNVIVVDNLPVSLPIQAASQHARKGLSTICEEGGGDVVALPGNPVLTLVSTCTGRPSRKGGQARGCASQALLQDWRCCRRWHAWQRYGIEPPPPHPFTPRHSTAWGQAFVYPSRALDVTAWSIHPIRRVDKGQGPFGCFGIVEE